MLVLLLSGAAWAAAPFDQDNAFYYLEAQCAFGPRNPGSPGHAQCLDFLKRELAFWTDTVITQPFQYKSEDTKETLSLTNIIGRIRPNQRDRVLLCAHWDTRPFADRDPDPAKRKTPIPGADDGASGVAVLLEVARQLKANPAPVGLDIVFFDGEDYGREEVIADYLIGSKHYVKNLLDPPPRFVILLDMIGQRDVRIPQEEYSAKYAKPVVDKIWSAAARVNAAAFVRENGIPVIDDHLPFMEQKIPAVDLIDFNYPYWHTTDDTPEHCSANSLGQVGRTLMDMLAHEEVQP
ncbi:MAG TPA: M28 family peptidase [bacterium]